MESETKKRSRSPSDEDVKPIVVESRPSGKTISVRKGDHVAWCTLKGGTQTGTGALFKVPQSQEVSRDVPFVAVALEPFSYDEEAGAQMTSVTYGVWKRYWQDADRNQIVAQPEDLRKSYEEKKQREMHEAARRQSALTGV